MPTNCSFTPTPDLLPIASSKSSTHRFVTPWWLALMAAACPLDALAAESDEQLLDPITITSSHGQDTNTIVNAKRIEVEQATTARDLFTQIPEVNVSGGPSASQKIYVRSLNERMLNVTIDGAIQSESAYHHTGQLAVEPELIKRIEVEAGTGAATAGPGALGGAIRLTTKNALDLLRPDEKAGALLKAGYQTNAHANKLTAIAFGRIGTHGDLLFSASRLHTGLLHGGDDAAIPGTSSLARNVFIKGGWNLSNTQRLELSHEQQTDRGLWNQRVNIVALSFNPPREGQSLRHTTTLKYTYKPDNKLIDFSANAYINNNRIELDLNKPKYEKLGARTIGIDLSNTSLLLTMHRLTYGLNLRHDTGYSYQPAGQQPNEHARVTGLFAEDRIALNDQWQFTVGGRFDHYTYTDILRQRYSSSGFSPSASLSYMPIEGLSLRLSHAHALRGVGLIEPYLNSRRTNASHIAPEKSRNTELGIAWDKGHWHAAGAVFHQTLTNVIGFDSQRENIGNVTIRGYNTNLGYKTSRWGSSIGMSEARPRLNGQPLTQAWALRLGAPNGRAWVAQFDILLPEYNVTMGWTARLQEQLNFGRTKPGYAVHDLYAEWRPAGNDKVTINFGVKNLFNKHYYDQTSLGYHARSQANLGFPEPGRDIRLGVALRF